MPSSEGTSTTGDDSLVLAAPRRSLGNNKAAVKHKKSFSYATTSSAARAHKSLINQSLVGSRKVLGDVSINLDLKQINLDTLPEKRSQENKRPALHKRPKSSTGVCK